MLSDKDIAFGLLALLAVVCALGTKSRAIYATAAGALFLNWAHYVASWTEHSLASLFWAAGWFVHNETLWEALDFGCGMFALAAWYLSFNEERDAHRPLLLLALTYFVQLGMHALYWEFKALPMHVYYAGLDGMFLGQIALFVIAGGSGVGDVLVRVVRRWGGHRDPRHAASRKA